MIGKDVRAEMDPGTEGGSDPAMHPFFSDEPGGRGGRPFALRLCLVTDPGMRWSRHLATCVLESIEGGVTAVQYRSKIADPDRAVREASDLAQVCHRAGVPIIVNDHIRVALEAGCDGVHLGQSDDPVELAREILGDRAIVGLTVTGQEDVLRAPAALIDYFGLSSVFATSTKPDAPDPLGLDGIERVRRLTRVPIVAIGGINRSNAASCIRSGADGIAVVSAIMESPDPRAESAALWREIEGALDGAKD
ncbi:thiamine phosphate synthase [Candidatus Fermentibacterales bacterium]|nr:thiamine phosphate synthase [Candidatus Fermentibacterales bacterium]